MEHGIVYGVITQEMIDSAIKRIVKEETFDDWIKDLFEDNEIKTKKPVNFQALSGNLKEFLVSTLISYLEDECGEDGFGDDKGIYGREKVEVPAKIDPEEFFPIMEHFMEKYGFKFPDDVDGDKILHTLHLLVNQRIKPITALEKWVNENTDGTMAAWAREKRFET